ncbi:MAG: SRPBCC family protein [Geminicoccaceae bacterium]
MTDIQSHITSITIDAPAEQVFAFMSDPEKMDRWSFGTWKTKVQHDGLIEGQAIFDGARTLVKIDADPDRFLIDYHLGIAKDRLIPRISLRVVPGPWLDLRSDQSVLTFIAWRPASMTDARWRRLTASHEFEAVLLKPLIEKASAQGAD